MEATKATKLTQRVVINFNGKVLRLTPGEKGVDVEYINGQPDAQELAALIMVLGGELTGRVTSKEIHIEHFGEVLLSLANSMHRAYLSLNPRKWVSLGMVAKIAYCIDSCLGQQGQCVTMMEDASRRLTQGKPKNGA